MCGLRLKGDVTKEECNDLSYPTKWGRWQHRIAIGGVIVAALVVTFRHGLTFVIGGRMSFVSGKTLLLWTIGIVVAAAAVVLASWLWRK